MKNHLKFLIIIGTLLCFVNQFNFGQITNFGLSTNYISVRTPSRTAAQTYYEFWDSSIGWAGIKSGNISVVGTINTTGNIGIGTTANYPLAVYKDLGLTAGEHIISVYGRDRENIVMGYRSDGTNITGAILRAANNYPLFLGTTTSTQAISILENGNVGIGTSTPVSGLHLYQNNADKGSPAGLTIEQAGTGNSVISFLQTSSYRWMIGIDHSDNDRFKIGRGNIWSAGTDITIDITGKVGIGTTAPKNILDIEGGVTIGATYSGTNTAPVNGLLVEGNVLIGKTSQTNNTYKLDVAGPIRANEIVINTTGADYVFAPNYRLRSLFDLESYIQRNGHLPEVPSASEMQQNGLSVSEMQTTLLKKVEELTLYVIELKKQNEILQQQVNQLKQ